MHHRADVLDRSQSGKGKASHQVNERIGEDVPDSMREGKAAPVALSGPGQATGTPSAVRCGGRVVSPGVT